MKDDNAKVVEHIAASLGYAILLLVTRPQISEKQPLKGIAALRTHIRLK